MTRDTMRARAVMEARYDGPMPREAVIDWRTNTTALERSIIAHERAIETQRAYLETHTEPTPYRASVKDALAKNEATLAQLRDQAARLEAAE